MSEYWKDAEQRRRERVLKEHYQEEMRWFAADLGLVPEEEHKREQKHYDPGVTDDAANFMLGLLGPAIDAVAEGKQEGSTDPEKLKEEQDAFLEHQAVLAEQRRERDIQAGRYQGSPLAQMTAAERQQMYRQNAIDRKQARWQRDYEAKKRAERRAQRRKELGME